MSEHKPKDRGQRLLHRLIGALVLTALGVILLPMILDFQSGEETAITRSNIPERPAGLRMEEIPLLPPAAPPESAAARGEAPPQTWVVRVGSFASAENANALRDQLRSKGFPAFVDEVSVEGRTLSRVQVGPETERTRGDALRDRLKQELKLDGIVVAYE